ncbi:MAG: hypothetical protein GQ547_06240 [Methylophaga sp.]|nr:hypothetical protein [Methylophaga sp.]
MTSIIFRGDYLATGRDCFISFYNRLKKCYDNESSTSITEEEKIVVTYEPFWAHYKQELGHYFRYLYRMFKYLNESFVDEEQKKLYASIIRAQLSDMETALLFYNCLSAQGHQKFKPLVEKYCLFDNLPHELLFNTGHIELYNESAFQT